MKRALFFGGALAAGLRMVLFVPMGSTEGQTGGDLSAMRADHALTMAFARDDTAGADQLLDARFTWIDARGSRSNRAEVVKTFPKIANSDVAPEVRLYGNAAVVRVDRERLHVLRVWVKGMSGWQAVLYQEVEQVEKSEPPAATESGVGVRECDNPCKTIPFEPETPSEKEAMASWQGVMRSLFENNAEAYAPLIADEFTATDTHHERPYTKKDRLAQILKQKQSGGRSIPPALLSAQMFDFGKTVMMIAREQRASAKAYLNTRMWVKRDGRWQMLFSFNTRVE